jgi:hypothetical protein
VNAVPPAYWVVVTAQCGKPFLVAEQFHDLTFPHSMRQNCAENAEAYFQLSTVQDDNQDDERAVSVYG